MNVKLFYDDEGTFQQNFQRAVAKIQNYLTIGEISWQGIIVSSRAFVI